MCSLVCCLVQIIANFSSMVLHLVCLPFYAYITVFVPVAYLPSISHLIILATIT